ncbi:tyrosine-protein phosphatase non-receptor type 23 isoform X2 [Thrips palmi]|uniref:Tyrosine-protein phosphatase non-receptor type 23 isoform X2 n=1 Tax=Thrips palmi TaxID=161013 RepID=A0A6P8Y2E7_THRPL|nr:tyrosine-protein phosphatase non-receptor type 23 isoform X2 [Thrips palmi]
MEAVPRLPMVCFELRSPSENPSFGRLKEYIKNFYHEDPDTYSQEIGVMEALRAGAVRPEKDVLGVANLKRYYCQLHFLMSRFPMVKDGAAAITFGWRDVYVGIAYSVADIRYEISSVLYNIGALHTQLGMLDTRTTEDGMKMACTHFQCAAWAFQHLKDTYPPSTDADVAPDIMLFAYHLCLAQAQECILEKSMMDNRKASIIVKVAVQVVNYYSQAFNALKLSVSEESVGTKVYTSWRRLAKFKEIYYRCVIQLFQGMQAEEQQKMGERVAFYQLAHETLEEAIKLSKNLDKSDMNPKQVQEALSFTQDVVEGKRKAAKNENEFIYHEEVPDRDQLPKAMGVSLVKGIPFSINDPEVSGQDIFRRLVPMKAHEASSLYSEEKAKLLRKVGGSIEEKDQLLTAFLSSLQLDYLHCYSEPNQLPQELVDRCAALSAKPNAIQSLVESMSKLSDVCVGVETMLQEIKILIEEEETLEKEYQSIMGKRPPSIVATDMTREMTKYLEAHAKANDSNQALHRVMSTHISNLRILSLPLGQLQEQIPPPPSLSDPESEKIVREMQNLMEKVEEMRSQRAMLTSQLRDSICKDDITQLLITHPNENVDIIFQEELKKHQDIVKLIQQNLSAQDNILKAVTDAYARYSNVRKSTAEVVRKRQSVINALISCFDAYEDLLAKSAKGHEFYNILETNVSKLLGRVKSTCRVQQEEREQMLLKSNNVLPQKIQNKAAIISDPSATLPKSSTPKLKDYLNSDGGINVSLRSNYMSTELAPPAYPSNAMYSPMPVDTSAHSGVYYDSGPNASSKVPIDNKPQSWMPGVRPAPLGSEATTSALKSEPSDMKNASYLSQTPAALHNTYPQQVYNYAGAWGYGSQASTMSTYLPTNVQYSVDAKLSDMSVLPTNHRMDTYSIDQGHRYTPVGGTSYQSTIEIPGTNLQASQENHLASGGYKNPSTQIPPPMSQTAENTIPVSMYQSNTGYESYQPTVAASVGTTYNAQNNSSAYQSPPYLAGSSSGLPSAYHSASGYGETSDQSGVSVYNSASNTIQNSGVSQYPNQFTQPANSYNPQVLPGYQNMSGSNAVSATQPNQYSYDQPYQAQVVWPSSLQTSTAFNSTYPTYQTAGSSNSSQFQYMDNQNVSSYSSAGSYPTSQTSSSYTNQAQAYPFNSSSTSTAGSYYASPPYGSQGQTSIMESTGSNQSSYAGNQQNYTTQGMYMQARMPNSDSYTTDTPNPSRSSHSEDLSSNIDLLAGLDFSINQQPLVPQLQLSKTPSEGKDFAPVTELPVSKQPAENNVVSTLPMKSPVSDEKPETLMDSMAALQVASDQNVKTQTQKFPVIDPFQDKDYLHQFTQEVEKYEKFVEGLTLKTLNGPTPLDIKWKEITELQERDSHRRSISVARCYPMKNRFPDILPYDCSRVELPSTKDDYINASHLKDLTPSTPSFILTQLPLPSTFNDFWIMVHEQQVEVIVCLLSDMELEGQRYWPAEKGQELSLGRMRLNLQTANVKQHWTERIISVYDAETRASKIVVHLQFTAWPGSSFPASPGPFLSFVSECLAFHSQQRVVLHPIVVHCQSGVGRTGLFCLTAAAVCEVQAGHGLIDLVKLTAAMSERRKAALRDREHLKFAYLSLLYYAQDILMKCGILTSGSSFEDKRSRSEDVPNQSLEVANQMPGTERELPASIPTTPSPGIEASHLTDLSQLKMQSKAKEVKSSRYTAESFKKANQSLELLTSNPTDPFSEIDPLWPLKRN